MERFVKKNKWGIGPDIKELINMDIDIGFEFKLPMTSRKTNESCLWEYGGRGANCQRSIGTVMSTANYKMPSAVLFNKSSKRPNSKQALVPMRKGHKLFVGKLFIGSHSVSIKVIEADLYSTGVEKDVNGTNTMFGSFIVVDVHNGLEEVPDPVEHLVAKLFAEDVLRAYYANGWNTTNCSDISNLDVEFSSDLKVYRSMNHLVLDLETHMVKEYNRFLTGVVQITDFVTNTMTFLPLDKSFRLKHVTSMIRDVKFDQLPCYSINLSSAMKGSNPVVVFGCKDEQMLRLRLENDRRTASKLRDGVFLSVRGFKG